MRPLCTLTLLILFSLSNAEEGEWKIMPTTDRGVVKEYIPTFEKHFSVEDDVLKGVVGLGKEFYEKYKCGTFKGVGHIWATHTTWPTDLSDFEMTFDYKWTQDEPGKKYGDFPDMNIGIRLNKEGHGYVINWGFLGQIRPTRMGGGIIGLGQLKMVKAKWVKVRILAAGPIIKVKMWPADFRGKAVEEPQNWNLEIYDDWEGTDETNYKKGAIAVGYKGRKLFDTCVYEFKNIAIKSLSKEDSAKVVYWDSATAPLKATKGSWNSNVKSQELPQANVAIAESREKDPNLKVQAAPGAIQLSSTDGKPACLWQQSKERKFSFIAKSTGGARPILAVKVLDDTMDPQFTYLDAAWRDGVSAVLWDNEKHTAATGPFVWKDDTAYEFVVESAHWVKWRISEVGNPKNTIGFSAKTYKTKRGSSAKYFGLGVIGDKGSVTITHAK